MSRKRFTERQTLECAILQGAVIPCYRCKVPFTTETVRTCEREHPHEVALDGPDNPAACAYSHDDCHKAETFGTGATTAGSSIGRIAKTKRILRTGKMVVVKPTAGEQRERRVTRPIAARANPWPPKGSQKIPNRGWRV